EALYTCMKKIDQETQYMLYLPDERSVNKDSLVDDIKHNFYIGVKTDENDILGDLSVHISRLANIKHIGYIVTGELYEQHHQGLATKMFQETIQWAEWKGLRRIELPVMTSYTPAVKFYEKLGFKIECIKHESIYMD